MKPNSAIFLELFTEIEQIIKVICGDPYNTTFSGMLRIAGRINPVVKQYTIDLREFQQLRNAIVHTRRENFTIAEPHPEVIDEVRHIRNLLKNPPKVLSVMRRDPYFTTPETAISVVLQAFAKHGFLRCPIVRQGTIVGLMNAKAISRWLTAGNTCTLNLENQTVANLLPFVDNSDFCIVAQNSDVLALVGLFKNSIKKGGYIQAALVTTNGKPNAKLVGIVTPSDLPLIIEKTGQY